MSQTEELDTARGHALTDIRSLHAACEEAARQEMALRHQLQVQHLAHCKLLPLTLFTSGKIFAGCCCVVLRA